MPTALTTPITKTITQYDVTAGNIDFAGQTVTIQVQFLDASRAVIETRHYTRTFTDLGLTATTANTVKTAIINRLKTEGELS